MAINVTIWNEFRHEKESEVVAAVYPKESTTRLPRASRPTGDFTIRTGNVGRTRTWTDRRRLEQHRRARLVGTQAHGAVSDEIVDRVQKRILAGMGLVVLHSGHHSKIFKRMMGTTANLKWREANDKERIWVVSPGHPIVDGLPDYFELEEEEMYGEFFDIPQPDELVFVSWFTGGEVFRRGCAFFRGRGKIFLLPSRPRELPDLLQRKRAPRSSPMA